ncbi:MAG: hypothetical protein Q4F72_12060, partial [Desulfovibrionaceae bacterium]|nr:hypothetical protein [Desulfovibrionaceae bacterium]
FQCEQIEIIIVKRIIFPVSRQKIPARDKRQAFACAADIALAGPSFDTRTEYRVAVSDDIPHADGAKAYAGP